MIVNVVNKTKQAMQWIGPPIIIFTLLFAVWEISVRLSGVADYLLPSPSRIIMEIISNSSDYALNTLVTVGEAIGGFVLGSIVAIIGAIAMYQSRFLERGLLPVAILVKVTPIIAIAPLFVIWFGFGFIPKILIAAIITFFPVLVNCLAGMRSTSSDVTDLLKSLDASKSEIMIKASIPNSYPYLLASFKIAIPLAVIGAVVAEWFSGDKGLGSMIIRANNNLDMPQLFGAVFILAFIGILLTSLVWYIEKRVLFWHDSQKLENEIW
jgi:NitT/TauT family transport system permease protein|tara:strand:+ start:23060 stop:23860 length:801 start_codon:yes stop_codon:yes gene_type:complete